MNTAIVVVMLPTYRIIANKPFMKKPKAHGGIHNKRGWLMAQHNLAVKTLRLPSANEGRCVSGLSLRTVLKYMGVLKARRLGMKRLMALN